MASFVSGRRLLSNENLARRYAKAPGVAGVRSGRREGSIRRDEEERVQALSGFVQGAIWADCFSLPQPRRDVGGSCEYSLVTPTRDEIALRGYTACVVLAQTPWAPGPVPVEPAKLKMNPERLLELVPSARKLAHCSVAQVKCNGQA